MSPMDKLRSAWVLQARIPLEPLSSRIRPAVFAKDKDEGGKLEPFLALGHRYLGAPQDTVILDSPASMANRMEEALYALRAELGLNDIRVDFGDVAYSIWQLPHRIYDAAVRDSQWSDQEFFQTDLGKKLALGDPQALFQWSPNSLLFGSWNSHAQAGIGARLAPRIERAVLAEVLGLGPERVPRPGSRRDPLGIPGDATVTEAYMERAKELGIFKKDDKGDEEGEGEGTPRPGVKGKRFPPSGSATCPPPSRTWTSPSKRGSWTFSAPGFPWSRGGSLSPPKGSWSSSASWVWPAFWSGGCSTSARGRPSGWEGWRSGPSRGKRSFPCPRRRSSSVGSRPSSRSCPRGGAGRGRSWSLPLSRPCRRSTRASTSSGPIPSGRGRGRAKEG
jgi:CRISPR-associated protein Csb1